MFGMAKKNGSARQSIKNDGGGKEEGGRRKETHGTEHRLHPDAKKSVWAICFFCVAVILALARFPGAAGPLGDMIYSGLDALLGWGYFILPLTLIFTGCMLLFAERRKLLTMTLIGGGLLILSVLALVELLEPTKGGWLGLALGSLRIPFGTPAAIIINCFILIISLIITANIPLHAFLPKRTADENEKDGNDLIVTGEAEARDKEEGGRRKEKKDKDKIAASEPAIIEPKELKEAAGQKKGKVPTFANYVPPPLSLLSTDSTKPTTGDLLANANIIKRTLESFGIPVDMGEINVGPAVTRYTLKPAEGVKLSRITALNPDLALTLAAHPIRIEAPIPGKSLVGIEVPNKAAALVRLGSLMNYPDFQKIGPMGFVLGRDVSGEPNFANIEKMPHMLIAGATGSGKSILVHSVLISLLYKNSPQTLKMVLIDPKRVELSVYEGIPHLVSPVITDNKKAAGVFRWAIAEMERRYETLQHAGCRDIKSYNAGHGDEPLPYILIAIDELADLMASFGREVEGSIVRLAQMARATGIHLLLSTQRPSVDVITGLIKANIPARVALQVASQIDSRTILDAPGAEKLLGHGDLLFLSAELSKPKRIQGAFVSEDEIKKVTSFIRDNNKGDITEAAASLNFDASGGSLDSARDKSGHGVTEEQAAGLVSRPQSFDDFLNNEGGDDDGDDLFDEALAVVAEAKKASASLLQRRLKVGYARAARLLDLMESAGYIGPGDGAKPRDVNIEKIDERLT
jgi:S-DNA-T family DNA segregation ATPase FtsK/SpoIIIE